VAESLKVKLRPAEVARLASQSAVRTDSYLAYLRGRTLLHAPPSPSSLTGAKAEFERAIALDPNNAAAHSGLADVTRMKGWWYPDSPLGKWDATSRRLVNRAIELDPNLAEAHASRGLMLADDFEYAEAEEEFKRALSLNPSSSLVHNWYGGLLLARGRTDEALVEFELADAADPLWTINLAWLALYLIWLGRLEAAQVKIRRLEATEPDGSLIHVVRAVYNHTRSDLDGCLKELDRWYEKMEKEDPRWKPIIRAMGYAFSGEMQKARALLRPEDTLPAHPGAQWVIASIYCIIGDLDESFRWIEKAPDLGQLLLDPVCEPIRHDPRFRAFLRKRKLA